MPDKIPTLKPHSVASLRIETVQDILTELKELLRAHGGATEDVARTADETVVSARYFFPTSSNLNTQQAAVWLGVAPRTLERWRCTGQGPPFVRANGRVFYRFADLEKWIEDRVVSSTAEANVKLS